MVLMIQKAELLTIANPTSAFLSAGPSFVPSPVTATTSRLGLSRLSMMPLTSVYLSCGDERASTRRRGQILSINSCFAYTDKHTRHEMRPSAFQPTQRTQRTQRKERKKRNKMTPLLDRPITAASDGGVCRWHAVKLWQTHAIKYELFRLNLICIINSTTSKKRTKIWTNYFFFQIFKR